MLIIILAYLKLVNLFRRYNKNDRGIYNGNVRSWTSNLGWYPFLSEREEIEKNFKLKNVSAYLRLSSKTKPTDSE